MKNQHENDAHSLWNCHSRHCHRMTAQFHCYFTFNSPFAFLEYSRLKFQRKWFPFRRCFPHDAEQVEKVLLFAVRRRVDFCNNFARNGNNWGLLNHLTFSPGTTTDRPRIRWVTNTDLSARRIPLHFKSIRGPYIIIIIIQAISAMLPVEGAVSPSRKVKDVGDTCEIKQRIIVIHSGADVGVNVCERHRARHCECIIFYFFIDCTIWLAEPSVYVLECASIKSAATWPFQREWIM